MKEAVSSCWLIGKSKRYSEHSEGCSPANESALEVKKSHQKNTYTNGIKHKKLGIN
jgi:hypothetical protein